MFCQSCGKDLGEMDTFCPYCGTKLAPLTQTESTAIQTAVQAPAVPEQQERPKTNVLAVIGFSFAFLAIAAAILSYFESGLLGLCLPASIAGLVLSIIGRVRCKKLGGSGKGFAITGIVLNAVAIALMVVMILLAFLAIFVVFGWLLLLLA